MAVNLDTDPHAELVIQTLRCGIGNNIELFVFKSPTQSIEQPSREDVGSTSVGFFVEDIDAATEYLKANDVKLLGEKKVVKEGSIAGC